MAWATTLFIVTFASNKLDKNIICFIRITVGTVVRVYIFFNFLLLVCLAKIFQYKYLTLSNSC